MQGLERIVLDQPFFAGLGPEFGAAISGCARNLRFAAGDYLFREDEPANEFYLLRQGSVALELHSPGQQSLIVATFREADILDGSWLVPPYRWTFDARASDLVRVLGVDARCLPTARDAPASGRCLWATTRVRSRKKVERRHPTAPCRCPFVSVESGVRRRMWQLSN
jgi:CRP/FNR family cyclic AMP-dependent transcriptional regulator